MAEQQPDLKDLRVLELSILLQHIRLGKDHLKKYLNDKQFAELTRYDSLTNKQRENIHSASTEKSGNFALALNTIFTCVLGAWLGLAGFMGTGIGSPEILIGITVVAALISACLGYYSASSSKTSVKNAITQQKLHNLQLTIIKLINQKRRNQIKNDIEYLNDALVELHNKKHNLSVKTEQNKFETREEIFVWLNQLNKVFEEKAKALAENTIYELYLDELTTSRNQLKKLLSNNIMIEEKPNEKDQKDSAPHSIWIPKEKNSKSNYIEVLTDPTIATPQYIYKKRSWFRTNFLNVLVGFLPTVLGGFGSMFVYFGGIPDMLAALGMHGFKEFVTHSLVKPIELFIAVFITVYFGYTFMRNNYKNMQREEELEKTKKQIANEEATLIEINAKLNFLRKLRRQVSRIVHLFNVLKRLSMHLHERKQQLDEYMEKYIALEKKIAVLENNTDQTQNKL